MPIIGENIGFGVDVASQKFVMNVFSGDVGPFGLVVSLFETFCSSGGITALTNVFSVENIATKAKNEGYLNYRLPLNFLAILVSPMKGVKRVIDENLCRDTIQMVKRELDKWIQNLSDKDVKGMDTSMILRQVDMMKDFFSMIHSDEEQERITKGYELAMLTKLFQCETLEKSLNAINEIKKFISKVVQAKESFYWREYLVAWLVNNNIIEQILNNNTHIELIKRSFDIFLFLAKEEAFTEPMLESLWNSQNNKQDDIVQEIYTLINAIVKLLPEDDIKFFYEKISETALENCNEKRLIFMKDFTINSLETFGNLDASEGELPEPLRDASNNQLSVPKNEHLYFAKRFWELIQDNSALPSNLLIQALAHLKTILISKNCGKFRPQYLYLCLENVKENRAVSQSLSLAVSILCALKEDTASSWVQSLHKQYDLVELFIRSCQTYKNTVKDSMEKLDGDIEDEIIIGKLSHRLNLIIRFNFLESIIKLSSRKIAIGKDNIEKLCALYLSNTMIKCDTRIFLDWVSWESLTELVFTQEETQVLIDILCNSREFLANSFGIVYYKCFANNFKIINAMLENIELEEGNFKVMKLSQLVKLDKLWDCVCFSTDEKSRRAFNELLIKIHTSFYETLNTDEVVREFVDRCFRMINEKSAVNEYRAIRNFVDLLLDLFDYVDGKKYEQMKSVGSERALAVSDSKGMFSCLSVDIKQVVVRLDMKLGQIRKKIADQFKIPFAEFTFETSREVYNMDDNDKVFQNIGSPSEFHIKRSKIHREDSKLYISKNKIYIDNLLLLLEKDDISCIESVWKLLNIIPYNKQLKEAIENINIDSPVIFIDKVIGGVE